VQDQYTLIKQSQLHVNFMAKEINNHYCHSCHQCHNCHYCHQCHSCHQCHRKQILSVNICCLYCFLQLDVSLYGGYTGFPSSVCWHHSKGSDTRFPILTLLLNVFCYHIYCLLSLGACINNVPIATVFFCWAHANSNSSRLVNYSST